MKNPKLLEYKRTLRGDLTILSRITLKDIFAGMAMNGILAGKIKLDDTAPAGTLGTWKQITEFAYGLADTMLETREGK